MPALPPFDRPLRAALFDLDGTLVDTLGDFVAALDAMLADLGRAPVPAATVETLIGQGSEHLIRGVLAATGPAEAVAALEAPAWAAYQGHYRRLNGRRARIYPGAAAALGRAQAAGLLLACVTNKPAEFAEALLRHCGLRAPFALVCGGDTHPRKKPDPLPLQASCAALGVAPAEALMVGDSSNDVRAARAAGCPVVLLSHGYNHGEPAQAAGADAVLDHFDQLWPTA